MSLVPLKHDLNGFDALELKGEQGKPDPSVINPADAWRSPKKYPRGEG